MTDHYFTNDFITLHYYKFGNGPKAMLGFHGYGMHGKQFKILESYLGDKYTFYGFDLFFHKQTKLTDQSMATVRKGLPKGVLAKLITEFCAHEHIDKFSVIGYSMGTHYATVVLEELPERVDEFILIAPAALHPGKLVPFFSLNKTGNWLLRRITQSDRLLLNTIGLVRRMRFIDQTANDILMKEFGTPELRFAFYACFTYLRGWGTDKEKFIKTLNEQNIKTIFIFGKHDMMYPPRIGDEFTAVIPHAQTVVLDDDHNMIGEDFASALTALL